MFAEALLLAAFQIGPLYQEKSDYRAIRPFYAREGETTDVLWPLFTAHRDWWRFCLLMHEQDYPDGGYQFELIPFWFQGKDYCGFFPLGGYHPHIALIFDFKFACWPLWMQYKMPRGRDWMTTNAILFPFVHWRSDGSWGLWPFYGFNRQRESDHRYVLWPLVTWADYREDRDTAGAGYSWMAWPLYGRIRRAREQQDMLLPPFFSCATTFHEPMTAEETSGPDSVRIRCPWPFFEYLASPSREHLFIWPFYERSRDFAYGNWRKPDTVTRYGWKLVELYDQETRVFPFYVHAQDPKAGTGYTRLWPFWEEEMEKEVTTARLLALFPIRWVPQIDRNWAKFWTFYESESTPLRTKHSLLWGLIRWRTEN